MTLRKVRCPQCKVETIYSPENEFRPFCSERCRLIDLGEWASETFRVPDETQKVDIENEQNLPSDEQCDD